MSPLFQDAAERRKKVTSPPRRKTLKKRTSATKTLLAARGRTLTARGTSPLLNDRDFVGSEMEDTQSGEAADLGHGGVAQVVEGEVELLQLVERVVVVGRRQVAQLVARQVKVPESVGGSKNVRVNSSVILKRAFLGQLVINCLTNAWCFNA